MSATMEAALEKLLAKHEIKPGTQGWIQCCCETPTSLYNSYADWARHVREDIAAEFLVVPYSEITGWRYAYEWTHDGKLRRYPAHSEDRAITVALEMRAQQRQAGQPVNAIPVSAPIPPWTPIPLPEEA